MPLPLLIGGAALLGGVTSFLGQRAANKTAQNQYQATADAERNNAAVDMAEYRNQAERRRATLDFARSYAQAHGYAIPSSAFDALRDMESPSNFPGHRIGANPKPVTPSPFVSGLLGAGSGAADALVLNKLYGGGNPLEGVPTNNLGTLSTPPVPGSGVLAGAPTRNLGDLVRFTPFNVPVPGLDA